MIEGNDAINGFEGPEIKQLVLNYQQMRSDLMNFRTVYRLLGKEHMLADKMKLLDANHIP